MKRVFVLAASSERLPATFTIHTGCPHCTEWHVFTCWCADGVWTTTALGDHASDAIPVPAFDVGGGMRQCGKCAESWEWDELRELAGCPACGALTKLQLATP